MSTKIGRQNYWKNFDFTQTWRYNTKLHGQNQKKWNSLVLSSADVWMVWRFHCILCFHFYFLFRTDAKKEHMVESNLHHGSGNYFGSTILKATWYQLFLKYFLNNFETYCWQQHLKGTVELKILRTWINIETNSFLGKNHQTKMSEGVCKTIKCTKIWACSPKKISLIHLLLYSSFSLKQT